jgi:branched-subunit amino acid aminotransferase/4-amino-4-deoxychorismate lyase
MTAVSHPERNEEGEFQIEFEASADEGDLIRTMTAGLVVGGRRPGSPLAGVKSLAWAEYHVARERARAAGFDEAILVDETGRLLEGAASNVFLVIGGRVLTPPVASGILPGVTRRLVFESAAAEGLPIEERDLPTLSLADAEEAFLTNALIGVASLVAVDGRTIGDGVPGPVTQRLFRARRKRLESGN